MNAHRRFRRACALGALGAVFAVPSFAADAIPDYVTKAVADLGRPPNEIARDANRKPAELVAFSGIKPSAVVVDFVPGAGYYTRILSKVVGPSGHVYMLVPMRGGAAGQVRANDRRKIEAKIPVRPEPVDVALQIQNISEYNNVEVLWESLFVYGGQFSVPVQVDAVWTSDNYHDLHNPNFVEPDKDMQSTGPAPIQGHVDMVAVNKQIFASLKPGGVYLIADHRAAPGSSFLVATTLHRSDEGAVKQEVLAAGFVLDGESNVLANPDDDHSKPVFQMHDKTDQFVLRFKKPDNASPDTKRPGPGAMDGYFGNTSQSGLGGPTHRWVFYHPDGTYEEYGIIGSLVQQGTWYWDAAGHNCMIHQFPQPERQGVVCHTTVPFQKPSTEPYGQTNGGTAERPYALTPGYTQPKPQDVVRSRY